MKVFVIAFLTTFREGIERLILLTPSSEIRNTLTEVNIHLLASIEKIRDL